MLKIGEIHKLFIKGHKFPQGRFLSEIRMSNNIEADGKDLAFVQL